MKSLRTYVLKEIDLNATLLTCNNYSLLFDSRQTTKEELQTEREREYSMEIVKNFSIEWFERKKMIRPSFSYTG